MLIFTLGGHEEAVWAVIRFKTKYWAPLALVPIQVLAGRCVDLNEIGINAYHNFKNFTLINFIIYINFFASSLV